MTASEPLAREPFRTVLVPTDFSSGADLALGRALLLPLAARTRVHLMHVLPPDALAKAREKAAAIANDRLAQLAARARKDAAVELNITAEVLTGEAFVEIIRCSRNISAHVDLSTFSRPGSGEPLQNPRRRAAMSVRAQLPAAPTDAALYGTRMFRSLLVPVDLSPSSDRVVGRVALLPLAEGARLTLLHVVPKSLPPRAQRRAEADAKKSLAAEATALTRNLPKGASIEAIVKVGTPALEIAKRAGTAKVDLIVMGRGGGRALRDVFLGSTAERVIRRGQLPVLVVRLPPRGPYRRPALALDLDQAAHAIVDMLLRVVPPPRPSVEVIHAYDIPYQGMIYPSLSDDDAVDYGKEYRQEALRKTAKLLATSLMHAKVAPTDAPSWRTHVRYGSPRTVIAKAVRKRDADLLVLGTHGHTGVAHAFLGTVAGDVLREVACDVLVVPPRDASEKA